MGIPKRKTNISIYHEKELTNRRQELLDNITKSDTYLPDSILHDDLDRGMLDYVKENFKGYTAFAWCLPMSINLLRKKGFEEGETCVYMEKKVE